MSRLKLLKLVLEKAEFGDSQETGFSRVKNYKIPAEIFKMVEMNQISLSPSLEISFTQGLMVFEGLDTFATS